MTLVSRHDPAKVGEPTRLVELRRQMADLIALRQALCRAMATRSRPKGYRRTLTTSSAGRARRAVEFRDRVRAPRVG